MVHLEYKAKTHIVKNEQKKRAREKKIKLKESVNWDRERERKRGARSHKYTFIVCSIPFLNIERKKCMRTTERERSKQH